MKMLIDNIYIQISFGPFLGLFPAHRDEFFASAGPAIGRMLGEAGHSASLAMQEKSARARGFVECGPPVGKIAAVGIGAMSIAPDFYCVFCVIPETVDDFFHDVISFMQLGPVECELASCY